MERTFKDLNKNIQQDIIDICLELQDAGFTIVKAKNPLKEYNCHTFFIYRDAKHHLGEFFKYDEVKEVVERLRDYMNQNGYKTEIIRHKAPNQQSLFQVSIFFRK